MKISKLKEILNSISSELDDLEVWIDTDESDGGRPVEDVELKYAADCCLDGDMTSSEIIYEDDVIEMLGIVQIPDDHSTFECTDIIMKMQQLSYRWEGDDYGEHRFSKKILAIKF